MEWALYLLLGAVAGTLAGLFGVGGGVIIVPILLFVFGLLDFSDSFAVHLAVGTSLACIVFTSLASLRAHHLLGHVCWPVWRRMTPGLVLGGATGSWLASRLPADTLRAAIALFLL
ncbi:MAG: sulfite exporter TauE/SafE family protein, partial [Pseudomonadales bacterium]|nr:sulfite exporter TauE/SafE family protein [Pseudomonadales bacterium]